MTSRAIIKEALIAAESRASNAERKIVLLEKMIRTLYVESRAVENYFWDDYEVADSRRLARAGEAESVSDDWETERSYAEALHSLGWIHALIGDSRHQVSGLVKMIGGILPDHVDPPTEYKLPSLRGKSLAEMSRVRLIDDSDKRSTRSASERSVMPPSTPKPSSAPALRDSAPHHDKGRK